MLFGMDQKREFFWEKSLQESDRERKTKQENKTGEKTFTYFYPLMLQATLPFSY